MRPVTYINLIHSLSPRDYARRLLTWAERLEVLLGSVALEVYHPPPARVYVALRSFAGHVHVELHRVASDGAADNGGVA